MPSRHARATEVDAYEFIKANLRLLNWDVRNPERADAGQVWTQNECLSNPEIKRRLGLDRPENIVRVTERVLWIIEAKREHSQLSQALREAERYAAKFKDSRQCEVLFISGVAGNEIDSFLIRTKYWDGTRFVPVTLNGVDATGLLSQADMLKILETGNPDIAEPEIDERLFISRAEHINEILHLGAVNPHQRAGVMAALLLSMLGHTPPNIDERAPAVLIQDINGRVQSILRDQGKPEFYDYIRINLPSTVDNHAKLRQALVDTLQELNNLNIRSAMNSGADWLGAFYEVFLKYASWAQDLGIVLTPRHLTRWVADVMDIHVNDIVYDPTCGTGGFLVAAFDYVKRRASAEQLVRFKQHSVFGVEQDAGVAALAVVNMIFRGDGKNNIKEGNCFSQHLEARAESGVSTAQYTSRISQNAPVTKVMMNPPFALKRSDEKEFRFINQALRQMHHGGLLFSVLPYSVMVKSDQFRQWRRDVLLAGNTLLAVITLPIDLFYPIGVTTVGVFIRKGTPHSREQNVLWVRALTDGLSKSKGKRLPDSAVSDDLEAARSVVKAFIANPSYPVSNMERFQKACPIDFSDPLLELVPENYLDHAPPSPEEMRSAVEQVVRDTAAFLIRTRRENDLEAL
jgi:type I restriction enzyme M protein